ncbi:Guanine nucleotide-binding protein G(o) subunit alpha-like protein [Leptotrombidium deliense]|uniref:Guanine nucleotide-binding protein G(O) subunit alpha-like protein n=1 Tax=Leptotrombidium deliense TaxID=299467 RepID=A0A443SL40_9ACAR|nr:Guanine nucleotide-binding protein G(o) subunit alpha-like protein [Leptotrombidium deliense]
MQNHFFENMDRICAENYLPTATDVLRARIRTIGVIETQFKVNDLTYRMVDVGGQKSERRKWMQCFDDVRAIIFVAALTAYDMILKHNLQSNRLIESLQFFGEITENKYFIRTAILLFLNKFDLFREKILYSGRHLRYYLTGYTSVDYDVDSAALFIQRLFERQNQNGNKIIYTHFTTATDTSNVQAVFQSVVDIIARENLRRTTFFMTNM